MHGLGLNELDDVLAVAGEIGLDTDAVTSGVADQEIKDRLTNATEAAIDAGVVGVPTVLPAGMSFWGDDQLEPAAANIAR